MGKFKVGDRVRYDDKNVSGVGVIHSKAEGEDTPYFDWLVTVEDKDRYWAYFIGDTCRKFKASSLTLATTPLNITPGTRYVTRSGKVTGPVTQGDVGFEAIVDGSVRVFDRAGGAVFGSGDDLVEAWAPKVGERVRAVKGTCLLNEGQEYEVIAMSKRGPIVTVFSAGGKRHDLNYEVERFEPLPVAAEAQPVALKIEAGKFYCTRDGRKVGPMHLYYDDGSCFGSNGTFTGGLWKPDGSAWFDGAKDSPDLIALWQDEPAAATTASNDNAPSTNGFTVPLVDDEDDDTTVTLTVTVDSSGAESALDAIIAKLERIAELQGQLGIRAA